KLGNRYQVQEDSAIYYYERAIALDPRFPLPYVGLALVYQSTSSASTRRRSGGCPRVAASRRRGAHAHYGGRSDRKGFITLSSRRVRDRRGLRADGRQGAR